MGKLEQNSVTDMIGQGIDLDSRWKEILSGIALKSGFIPDVKLLRKSEWWKTGKIGAVHCPGILKVGGLEKRGVLKIQGTKPSTSEADMISAFEAQNKSKIIRPPKIYYHSPWDDKKQYEAFIMEEVKGSFVIVNHPASDKELNDFFNLYREYQENCIKEPWVAKPKKYSYSQQVDKWMSATQKERENDSFKEEGDFDLAQKGIRIIEENFDAQDLEFMHGHFQPGDLIVSKPDEVVLFSNLMWSYRIPFYDAVFGYHWWMLGMEHAKNFSEELLEKERERWFDEIYSLGNRRLINLALLERAIPALMVDRYMMDQSKPSAEIITKGARRELQKLVKELEK